MIGNSLSLTAHATESGLVSIQKCVGKTIYIEREGEREKGEQEKVNTPYIIYI